ncbi:hypothetical protein A4A49_62857, partial [Nicotiana attenuata]
EFTASIIHETLKVVVAQYNASHLPDFEQPAATTGYYFQSKTRAATVASSELGRFSSVRDSGEVPALLRFLLRSK